MIPALAAARLKWSRPPGARLTGRAGGLPNVRPGELLPNGGRVRGINLLPSLAQERAGATGIVRWTHLWADWDASAMKVYLDRAAVVGCNAIRIQGTVRAQYIGALTRAQYHARWTELSDYCQERGLFLFACGMDGGRMDGGFANTPWGHTEDELLALVAHLDTLPDVMGIDLVQEATDWRTTAPALALYQQAKTLTAVPLTFSSQSPYTTAGILTPNYLADRTDFFSFHIYYGGATTAALDAYWNAGGTRPIIIGEFSHNIGQAPTAASWAARYREVLALLTHVGPQGQRVVGAMPWSTGDTYDEPIGGWGGDFGIHLDNYGIFDLDGVERTYITDIFRQFPKV